MYQTSTTCPFLSTPCSVNFQARRGRSAPLCLRGSHAGRSQVVPVIVRADRFYPMVPLISRDCRPFSAEVGLLASACLRVPPATMPPTPVPVANTTSSKSPEPPPTRTADTRSPHIAVCDSACRQARHAAHRPLLHPCLCFGPRRLRQLACVRHWSGTGIR
jgi:hypothetical protein